MNAIDQLLHVNAKNILGVCPTADDTRHVISPDLVGSEHICKALGTLVAFDLAIKGLPKMIADLKTERIRVEARLPGREAAIKAAQHPVRLIEASLRKLHERLDRNLVTLETCPEPAEPAPVASLPGLKLPATRREIIAGLRAEIADAELKLAEVNKAVRHAESLRRRDQTRLKNIPVKLAELERELRDCQANLPEMDRLAKKTAMHIKNRRAHRARKAARTATVPGFENADGSLMVFEDVRLEPLPPVGQTDEQLRLKAARFFGESVTDEQLAELRNDPEFLEA